MVGGSDGHRVKQVGSLIKHLAEIAETLGFGIFCHHLLGMCSSHVYVAQGRHLHHAGTLKVTDNLFTPITYTDIGYLYLLFHIVPLGVVLRVQYVHASTQCQSGRCQ